jgi:hypothetical protein
MEASEAALMDDNLKPSLGDTAVEEEAVPEEERTKRAPEWAKLLALSFTSCIVALAEWFICKRELPTCSVEANL